MLLLAGDSQTGGVVFTVSEKTCAGSLVQTHQSQIPHNPQRRTTGSALDGLCDLALDLQADFDDFERVGEDLDSLAGHLFLQQ